MCVGAQEGHARVQERGFVVEMCGHVQPMTTVYIYSIWCLYVSIDYRCQMIQ